MHQNLFFRVASFVIAALLISCSKDPVTNEDPNLDEDSTSGYVARPLRKIVTIENTVWAPDSLVFQYESVDSDRISSIKTYGYGGPIPESEDYNYSNSRLDSITVSAYWGNPFHYSYMYTFVFNYEDDKIQTMSYHDIWESVFTSYFEYDLQGRIIKISQPPVDSPLGDTYNEIEYDGDNISTEYSYTRDHPDSAYKLYKTVTFTYDDKINPFHLKYPIPQWDIVVRNEHAKYLSKNNVTSLKSIYEWGTSTETFSYEYDNYGCPIKVDYKWGSEHLTSAYYY